MCSQQIVCDKASWRTKPGFSQLPINRRVTAETKRMHVAKAGDAKHQPLHLGWLSADTPLTHRHPLPLAPLGGPPRELAPCPGFAHTGPAPGSLPALIFKLLFHFTAADIHLLGELEMEPVLRAWQRGLQPALTGISAAPPFRGGCVPQSLLGGLRSAEGTH